MKILGVKSVLTKCSYLYRLKLIYIIYMITLIITSASQTPDSPVFLPINFLLRIQGIVRGEGIATILNLILTVAVVVALLWECCKNKGLFLNTPYFSLLAALLLTFSLTILLNARYGVIGNIKTLIFLVIQFTFFYFVSDQNNYELRSQVISICKVVSSFSFATTFISILYFFYRFSWIGKVNGKQYLLGLCKGRLWGIFWDPNFAAVFSVIGIISAVIILDKSENTRPFQKVIWGMTIFSNYIYIILSGSRTGKICLFVASIILVLNLLLSRCDYSRLKKFLKIVAISLAAGATVMFLMAPIKAVLLGVVNSEISFGNIDQEYISDWDASISADELLTRDDTGKYNEDISNTRFTIWKSATEILMIKPIFGAGNRTYIDVAKDLIPDNFVGMRGFSFHNDYLHLLVSTGIVGFVIGISFAACCGIAVMKYIAANFRNKEKLTFCIYLISFIVVICCAGMFIDVIFLVNNTISCIFWVMLGYLMSTVQDKKKDTLIYVWYKKIYAYFSCNELSTLAKEKGSI